MTPVKIWLGYPYPLGATWLGNGVNFSLFSEMATSVDLCLFDNLDARQENIRIPMTEQTDQVWHVFLPDARDCFSRSDLVGTTSTGAKIAPAII